MQGRPYKGSDLAVFYYIHFLHIPTRKLTVLNLRKELRSSLKVSAKEIDFGNNHISSKPSGFVFGRSER